MSTNLKVVESTLPKGFAVNVCVNDVEIATKFCSKNLKILTAEFFVPSNER